MQNVFDRPDVSKTLKRSLKTVGAGGGGPAAVVVVLVVTVAVVEAFCAQSSPEYPGSQMHDARIVSGVSTHPLLAPQYVLHSSVLDGGDIELDSLRAKYEHVSSESRSDVAVVLGFPLLNIHLGASPLPLQSES